MFDLPDIESMSREEIANWISRFFEKLKFEFKAKRLKHAVLKPILGRETSPTSAREFIDRYFCIDPVGTVTLAYWRDEYFVWEAGRYRRIEEQELRGKLYEFLGTAQVLNSPKAEKVVVPNPVNGEREVIQVVPRTPNTVVLEDGTVKVKAKFPAEREYVNKILDALAPQVLVRRDVEPPHWRRSAVSETLWPAREVVACRNGLLHAPSRHLISHSPDLFNLNVLDVDYDPAPPYPEQWFRFLQSLWPDDFASVETLQEIFGYMVAGDLSQEKIFLFQGARRGGKGTIARMLQALLGADNVDNSTVSGLAGEFGLQSLIGKTACIVEDARFDGLSAAQASNVAGKLLTISGRGRINVNRKGISQWNGQLGTRFLICSNTVPRFTDASGTIASRFVPLIFTRSFEGHEDRDLGERLKAELPSILNWALDGYDRLKRRGHFDIPGSATSLVRDMAHYASPVQRFVDECGYVVEADRDIVEATLFVDYCGWCDRNGFGRPSKGQFTVDLRAAYPLVEPGYRPREDEGTGRPRRYRGIGKRELTATP